MLYLVLHQLATPSAVAADRNARFAFARLYCGHLFLLAWRCLVAQRSMLGDWIQSSRSDHGHSRHPLGISTPTACLPAFALPTATTSGMPWPATACEPRSICVVPCTPSSLCTCKLACQNAVNDVAATAPSGSSCLLPALVYSVLLPLYLRLSYLDRPALCQEKRCRPTCSFALAADHAVFLHRSGFTLVFSHSQVGFLVIRSAKAARSPSEPQAASNRTVNRHSIRAIGHLRHCLSLDTRRRKFGRCDSRLQNPLFSPFDIRLSYKHSDRDLRARALGLTFG
jgi:hypothetical protein